MSGTHPSPMRRPKVDASSPRQPSNCKTKLKASVLFKKLHLTIRHRIVKGSRAKMAEPSLLLWVEKVLLLTVSETLSFQAGNQQSEKKH